MAPRKTVTKKAAPSKPRKQSKLAKPAQPDKPLTGRKTSIPLKGRSAVFVGKVFVMSGEFPSHHDVMEGWITHHGGRVDKVITDETTHLVCTMDNFKNKVPHVKDAWKLGKTRCKIVDWEFVEDSVWPKPIHLPEDSYQLEKMLAGKKRKRTIVVRHKNNGGKDSKDSKEVIEPPCHHVYIDKTGFKYNIVLHRIISPPKDKKLEESFTIYIFESNPMPPTYVVAKKYKRADMPAALYHDKDVGKGLQKALEEFKSIFEDKTGIKWDQRLDKLKQDEQQYVYMPPTGGKPVGVLPFGWKKPGQNLEQELDSFVIISDGKLGGDCRVTNPDLMDDTDSGDGAN